MNRVVVTGLGVISPIGNSIKEFETNLYNNISGAGKITRFDTGDLPTKIGAEVKNFKSEFRDVKISYALKAAQEAMNESFPNGVPDNIEKRLSIGIGLELFSMEDLIEAKSNGLPELEHSKAMRFLNTPSDLCCHLISKNYGFNQSPLIHISACAAGTDAIGSAYQQIKRGNSKVILAGGTDSMINPMGVAGFCRIGAMSTKNDTPHLASTPFSKNRDGFLLGEGAAFLVLEDYEHAKNRNAKIYGEISGYGNSLDAYSISDPHPQGAGAIRCMQRAINDASLTLNDISAISAHGTGTPKNDPAESKAIRTLFKDKYKEIPVFATKSQLGHLISAAGAVESVVSILALKNNLLHPTLNLKDIDEDCNLFHIKKNNLEFKPKHILKNSFGFGGQNASIIISRFE